MKIGFFEILTGEQDFFSKNLIGHQLVFSTDPINGNQILSENDFEIVCTRSNSKLDSRLINQLNQLKLIITRTTGYDHIDIPTAHQKGITVCNIPAYGEITVAEYTFALLLNLARKVTLAINQVKGFINLDVNQLQGFDLSGKTLGVVGTGHIGMHVIRIANGFGLKVIAYDAYPNKDLESQQNFHYLPLDQLLAQSDIITLHVPYLPSTHHLISHQNINQIKPGAILVNTARGAVVETDALIKALDSHILAGAALDVLEEEQAFNNESQTVRREIARPELFKTLLENHLLTSMPNVIVTPHNAFNTVEAEQRILDTTVENITKFIAGQTENIVK